MALPGSELYKDALDKGHNLPENYEGYSFHSYNTIPLPTKSLEPFEILKFRDDAFKKYYSYEPFLDKIEKKFGAKARQNIIKMNKISLKRKILLQEHKLYPQSIISLFK